MTSLIAYRKITDAITTHTLRLPQPLQPGDFVGHELATLPDGRTVVVVGPGYSICEDQPSEITGSIEQLSNPLPAALRDEIRKASPHVRLIGERMQAKIRESYSAEDEMKFSRIGTGHALGFYVATEAELAAVQKFGIFVQQARTWAGAERAGLGL